MTQACDLEHAKVTSVVLFPHYSQNEFKDAWEVDQRSKGQNPKAKAWRRYCDEICEGTIWNLNLLNAQSDGRVEVEHRIVDFHEVFTLPRPVLESLLKARDISTSPVAPSLSRASFPSVRSVLHASRSPHACDENLVIGCDEPGRPGWSPIQAPHRS